MKVALLIALAFAGLAILGYLAEVAFTAPLAELVTDPFPDERRARLSELHGGRRIERDHRSQTFTHLAHRNVNESNADTVARSSDSFAAVENSRQSARMRIGTVVPYLELPSEGTTQTPDLGTDSAGSTVALALTRFRADSRNSFAPPQPMPRLSFREEDGPKFLPGPWENATSQTGPFAPGAMKGAPIVPENSLVQSTQPILQPIQDPVVHAPNEQLERSGSNYMSYVEHLYRAQIGRRAYAKEVTEHGLGSAELTGSKGP